MGVPAEQLETDLVKCNLLQQTDHGDVQVVRSYSYCSVYRSCCEDGNCGKVVAQLFASFQDRAHAVVLMLVLAQRPREISSRCSASPPTVAGDPRGAAPRERVVLQNLVSRGESSAAYAVKLYVYALRAYLLRLQPILFTPTATTHITLPI